MSDKHWDADDAEGKFIEVNITPENGDECVYWVNISNLPEEEDEYDWSIDVAVSHHNKSSKDANVTADEAEACEPFSRNESEFEFIHPS